MAALLALLVALVVAACGGTPGSDTTTRRPRPPRPRRTRPPPRRGRRPRPSRPCRRDGFESLGPVELNVWSYDNQDPGLMPVITELTKQFMAKYPNVKINLKFKDFNSLVDTVNRALASDNGPDITEGNQGYQIDAAEVKAKLILPLDPYVKAYGWDKWWGAGHEPDLPVDRGRQDLRPGPDLGHRADRPERRPVREQEEAGRPRPDASRRRSPSSTRCSPTPKSKLGDDPIFEFGNKEGYGTIHFIGGLQGAYGDAQPLRDWIYHVPGSTFETPQNIQALTKLAEWGKAGYFNKDYNAVGYDQAAAEFAKGKGLFFVGGNWETAIIKAGLGADAGMINMPPGESGKHVGVGATSGPWHISAKTKYPDVAAAWLNYIHSLARGRGPDVQGAADPGHRGHDAAGRRSVPGRGHRVVAAARLATAA